jgi:hypothetical protein
MSKREEGPMTKALLMAGALVALTLAMQEVAAGQPAEDPLADMKAVKLKRLDDRPSAKRPGDKLTAPIPAGPSQPLPPQAAEEEGEVRPGFAPLAALLSNGGGTYTTSNKSPPPPVPPPQAQAAQQPNPSSSRPSSPWSNLWWGFK